LHKNLVMAKLKKEKVNTGNERVESIETTLSKAEQFIEQHQKKISYVVLAAVVIVLLIMGYNKFIKQPKETQAFENMFIAEYYFEIDSLNLALNGDGNNLGFLDIIDEYKWTAASNLSHYYIGMIYMKQEMYDDAIKHLKKYKSKDVFTTSMSNGAIGDAYVEIGDYNKAVKYYLLAANTHPNQFTSPMFLKKAAWVYETQNDYHKALDIFQTIKKDYFRTQEGREADKYITYFEAKIKQ